MDYAEHLGTYRFFCKLTLWTIVVTVAIVAAMGYFLT
jgi:hypothetical protein